MAKDANAADPARMTPSRLRVEYEAAMAGLRGVFPTAASRLDAGVDAVRTRSAAADALIQGLWAGVIEAEPGLAEGFALVASGGYGRRELLPFSDVDLIFLTGEKTAEKTVKEAVRRMNQSLWDAGLRAAPMTRTLAECERFDGENAEFTLALLDARHVAGDAAVSGRLLERGVPRVIARDRKRIVARLLEMTQRRHARFGGTLFHLEPTIKECPGGLRDAHVCAWLARLHEGMSPPPTPEFEEARAFLLLVRVFLHLRHGRDDNTLDWQSQDEAAARALGTGAPPPGGPARLAPDYWMRLYFRHARAIERSLEQVVEEALPEKPRLGALARFTRSSGSSAKQEESGFELRAGKLSLKPAAEGHDGAAEPDVALGIFTAMARSGARLARETESRLEAALPLLSAHLEDGPGLWHKLETILTAPHAGTALRTMHALGILELVIPEFHGIDALVVRDAYHRYTVDEHTFVVIDTLHGLATETGVPAGVASAPFAGMLRDLPHPGLLYLAALLHDTGKGHAHEGHAAESARLAQKVLERLEIDPYEAALVLDLIRNHLEMSAALRRDVFDRETIRSFAARVGTPLALRMLTLFTYADICAVHPDALTPWKAENLWRLSIATVSFLDRNVDEERVAADAETVTSDAMHRIRALLPDRQAEVVQFLEGFPTRYLATRSPDQVRMHFEMASRLASRADSQLDFRYAPAANVLTLVTADRPGLFASVAGALAGWGMNIVSADAFSNAQGIVVDSFRFTDTFRTLELNESERDRFAASLRGVMDGSVDVETLLAARRRGKRPVPKVSVKTRVEFTGNASMHSTLLEVVAQDTPGLLYALSLTFARHRCNIEVALVDTEGEMAIDVFYLTRAGAKLDQEQERELGRELLEAIAANAR